MSGHRANSAITGTSVVRWDNARADTTRSIGELSTPTTRWPRPARYPGVPAGAAGRVECVAGWEGVDDLVHDGLVFVEQAVAGLVVVGGGPLPVAHW